MLVRNGRRLMEGERIWRGALISAFPLYALWLKSMSVVRDFWAYCQDTGLDGARVLGSYNGSLGRFIPSEIPAYLPRLPEFAADALSFGQRIKFDLCADGQPTNQASMFTQVAIAFNGAPNVIMSGGNEADKNGWSPENFAKPSMLTSSKGSRVGDALPFHPVWDLADFHPDRGDGSIENGYVRKCKSWHDLYVGDTTELVAIDGPINCDEPIGLGPVEEPGRTSANPNDWWEFTAGCVGFGACAVTAHTRSTLVESTFAIPDAHTTALVVAGIDALNVIPRDFAFGEYSRGEANGENTQLPLVHLDRFFNGGERPQGAVRTYSMRVGNQALVMALQPGALWTPQPQAGWRIEQAFERPDGLATMFLMSK